MHISPERRERWARLTKNDPFNLWLGPQVTNPDGTLDLEALHQLSHRYGIDRRAQYANLNPGQVRMNLGNMLRKVVPVAEYGLERNDIRAKTNPTSDTSAYTQQSSSLETLSIRELLARHSGIMTELKRREVVRTANNPVGDYAELLFSTAFGWNLATSSTAGYDATDGNGLRYQIKSRRLASVKTPRYLSSLRRLPEKNFDYLAAVLFDADYNVQRAIILPHECLEPQSRFRPHTNGWTLSLKETCWSLPGARDVTEDVKSAASSI